MAEGYRIPIIFITAYPNERTRARALEAGAVDFLTKPFGEEALRRGIRTALELSDGEHTTGKCHFVERFFLESVPWGEEDVVNDVV